MQTLQIRNSTAEFLIFTNQNKEKTIEVIVDNESVWLNQKLIAELFDTTRNNVTMHLNNILECELDRNSVCKDFLHTAAEVIVQRANHEKENMGLTTWKNSPNGKIMTTDVVIAKNYLTKEELKSLERIVTMYLDYAEDQAQRHIPMTIEDWKKRLDAFLQFNEREVLDNLGKVTHKVAESFALSEFEKYRVIQDKVFESDFDKFMIEIKT